MTDEAQIEAAAKQMAMFKWHVAKITPEIIEGYKSQARLILSAALTAAAEAGDEEFDPQDWLNDVDRFRACIHRTIERCAQVADAIEAWDTECVKLKAAIAAAIRALKEVPPQQSASKNSSIHAIFSNSRRNRWL